MTKEDWVISLPIPISKKLLGAQKTDTSCRIMVNLVGTGARFTVNANGPSRRKAPINWSIQVSVRKIYRQVFLCNGHHPILAAHSDTLKMYDKLRHHFHWPHMNADVQTYILSCKSFSRHRLFQKHQRWRQLFSTSEPFEFVAIGILGTLAKTG